MGLQSMGDNTVNRTNWLIAVAALVLAACGDDSARTGAAESSGDPGRAAAAESGIPSFNGEMRRDPLAGGRSHGGADPHAKLTAEQHVKVALRHWAEGRRAEAMDVLDKAVSQFGNHAGLLAVRASLLLEEGDAAKALADLEAAVGADPRDPLLRVNRAQAYRMFRRDEEARADLDKALELEPDMIAARFNRGVLLFSQDLYREALADFDRCIATDPEALGPYFNRAVTRDALGDREGAIGDLNRFLELAGDNENLATAAEALLRKWSEEKAAKVAAGGQ